jgi:SAM-dependent methyltransferase
MNSAFNPKIKDLLIKFYTANFQKAGANPEIGKRIIEESWDNFEIDNHDLKKQINKFFLEAKTQLSKHRNDIEIDPSTLLDYSSVDTFVDYGANKLETINRIGNRVRTINNLVAIDVIPQNNKFKFPVRSKYIQIQEDPIVIPLKNQSVDLINVQYVFHHFKSDEQIDNALREFHRILKPKGRVILWEESFEAAPNVQQLVIQNNNKGIFSDYELTQEFYNLSNSERMDFIFLNDWILNVNNHHMQWTMLYKSWDDWINRLQNSNFRLQSSINFGLRISGQLKKGVQMAGEFEKILLD